jgi:cobyric acid synthase
MSTSSKGSVEVNPYPNLSKSINSSIVLMSKEIVALPQVMDRMAMGVEPSMTL